MLGYIVAEEFFDTVQEQENIAACVAKSFMNQIEDDDEDAKAVLEMEVENRFCPRHIPLYAICVYRSSLRRA